VSFLRIHAQPGRTAVWTLSWFLFAAGIVVYFYVAEQRHRENPDDRVMPTISQMVRGFSDAALKPAEEEETQTGGGSSIVARFRASMLWKDTLASGRRFVISVALLFPAVLLGLHMAMFPALHSIL